MVRLSLTRLVAVCHLLHYVRCVCGSPAFKTGSRISILPSLSILHRGGSTTNTRSSNNTKTSRPSWWSKGLQRFRDTNITKSATYSTSSNDDLATLSSLDSNTTSSGTSPVIQTNPQKNRTGWFQQRQPWRNVSKTNGTVISSNDTKNSTGRKTIKHTRQLQKSKSNSATTNVTNDESLETTGHANTKNETSLSENTNESNHTLSQPQHQLISAPGGGGVIVIGPGLPQQQSPHPQQYYRGQPVIVPIRGNSNSGSPSSSSVVANPTNSLAIVLIELLTSIIGKAMYLWFFTWLTKRLAQQEEGIILPTQHYVWERLNDRYSRDAVALQTILREPPLGVPYKKWQRQHIRKLLSTQRPSKMLQPTLAETFTRTVVVVELSTFGDSPSGSVDNNMMSSSKINFQAMPDVISFLIQQQRQHAFGTLKATGEAMPLEIIFIVNSPGGEVSKYGLAAAQMRRLKNQPNITTTVCVDKYAASGGFMIASQADKLVAAPFATIGSVGVIVEGLNFYELAKRYGVQPLVIKAGESKNPLSQWGPVTRQDLAQEQQRLEKVHEAFKQFVTEGRPGIVANSEHVMDGSIYLGMEAKSLGLIDSIMTTDEYIFDRIEAGDRVLRLHRSQHGRFTRQLRLSPLDILPHLRSWISSALRKVQMSVGDSSIEQ